MKSIADREKLRRRASVSHALSLGGLAILLVGVLLPLWQSSALVLTEILLVGGFTISVVGIYFANRWVKKPRPENTLDKALGSFSDQYRLYHYSPLCDHLMLTPSGLVVIETVNLDGEFSYKGGAWKQKMSINRAIRFLFDERLGDPIVRAQESARLASRWAEEKLPNGEKVPVTPLVVFVHPAAALNVDSPAVSVVMPQKAAKRIPTNLPRLSTEVYHCLEEALDAASGAHE